MGGRRQTADVIVVGGGLHGCATALYLKRTGLDPIILEKDHLGRHASGANAGGVRRLGRALPEIPLAVAALEQWRQIADLVDDDCDFVAPGQIKVAETEARLEALRARRATVLAAGFDHEEIIGPEDLYALLPALKPGCVGGMLVRGDGHANPFRTVLAYRRKLEALGVRILEGAPVRELSEKRGKWTAKLPDGAAAEAPVVANCAGAWGGRIAGMLGDKAPVEAQALMLLISGRMPPFVQPVVGAQGRSLSFKQFANGTVMMGGAYRGWADPETNRTWLDDRGLAANAGAAAALFPIINHASIVRCWAGIEGRMPDDIPVIGPGIRDGVFHAFGFSAHGFALSPIVGGIVADLIAGRGSNLPIEAFSVGRFL